jgi:hypothetical protein
MANTRPVRNLGIKRGVVVKGREKTVVDQEHFFTLLKKLSYPKFASVL